MWWGGSNLNGNHEPLRQEGTLGRTILVLATKIISTPSNCYLWTTTSRLDFLNVLDSRDVVDVLGFQRWFNKVVSP